MDDPTRGLSNRMMLRRVYGCILFADCRDCYAFSYGIWETTF